MNNRKPEPKPVAWMPPPIHFDAKLREGALKPYVFGFYRTAVGPTADWPKPCQCWKRKEEVLNRCCACALLTGITGRIELCSVCARRNRNPNPCPECLERIAAAKERFKTSWIDIASDDQLRRLLDCRNMAEGCISTGAIIERMAGDGWHLAWADILDMIQPEIDRRKAIIERKARGELDTPPPQPEPLPDYLFRRMGEKGASWEIRFEGGERFTVEHQDGMTYIHALLSKRDHAATAQELYEIENPAHPDSNGRKVYTEAWRQNVSGAINRAIKKIGRNFEGEDLAKHLKPAIKKGRKLHYGGAVDWTTR